MSMYTIIALVVVAITSIAAYFFWDKSRRQTENANYHKKKADEHTTQLEQARKELSELRGKGKGKSQNTPKKSEQKKSDGAPPKNAKAYKQEIRALREQLKKEKADRASADRETAATTAVEESAPSGVGSRDLVALREELMEAKTEAANLKSKLETVEAERVRLKAESLSHAAPEQKVSASPSINVNALQQAHKDEIKETVEKYQSELKSLKSTSESSLKQTKEELLSELKSLRSKSRRNQNDAEQQRRRADNNDKAYKITRLQLDAALEKLALVDPETHAPGGFYDPEIEAILQKEAEEKAKVQRAKTEKANREAAEKAQQAAAAKALAAAAAAAQPTAAEVKPAPVVEAKPEPVVETKPEPVVEAKPEPVVETKPEPVVEAKPEPAAEAQPTPEPKIAYTPVEQSKPEPLPASKEEEEPKKEASGWTAIGLAAITEVTGKDADTFSDAGVTFDPASASQNEADKAVVAAPKESDSKDEGDALTSLDTSILDDGWDLGGGGLDSILKSE